MDPLPAQGSQARANHHRKGHQEGNLSSEKLAQKTGGCAKHSDDQIAADSDTCWNL